MNTIRKMRADGKWHWEVGHYRPLCDNDVLYYSWECIAECDSFQEAVALVSCLNGGESCPLDPYSI